MDSESTKIWDERHRLQVARCKRMTELMHDYDRDVHRPAMGALIARCAAIGHKPQDTWHYNGLGWSFRYCRQCGARVETVCEHDV